MKKLDLAPIERRLANGDYLPQPHWAEEDITDLLAEVKRLRKEVKSLLMDEISRIGQEQDRQSQALGLQDYYPGKEE